MFELIVIIFIIYVVYKKSNKVSSIQLIKILKTKGFSNITIVRENLASSWITATFHGDTYLFEVTKNVSAISNNSIQTLSEYAANHHYHNVVIFLGNSPISNVLKNAILKHNIQIWDNAKLNSFSNKTNQYTIISKLPLDDHCKIDVSEDPIQEGTKANSLLGNLFSNKIEKL